MVTAGGPSYRPLLEMDPDEVREALSNHMVLGLEVARKAAPRMRPGGTLVLIGGTGGRRVGHGLGIVSTATAALPPFTAALVNWWTIPSSYWGLSSWFPSSWTCSYR